jgi:hypothetical protein
MLLLLSLMASTLAPDARLDFQMMITPAYQAFARKGDAMCPARKLRYLHPGDLDFFEEQFLFALPARTQKRVTGLTKGIDKCPEMGASCPAQHTLAAIRKAGLLDAFTTSACSATG